MAGRIRKGTAIGLCVRSFAFDLDCSVWQARPGSRMLRQQRWRISKSFEVSHSKWKVKMLLAIPGTKKEIGRGQRFWIQWQNMNKKAWKQEERPVGFRIRNQKLIPIWMKSFHRTSILPEDGIVCLLPQNSYLSDEEKLIWNSKSRDLNLRLSVLLFFWTFLSSLKQISPQISSGHAESLSSPIQPHFSNFSGCISHLLYFTIFKPPSTCNRYTHHARNSRIPTTLIFQYKDN